MRTLLIALFCLAVSPLVAASTKDKKLIEYGWDVPDTAYMREHVREMEKVPYCRSTDEDSEMAMLLARMLADQSKYDPEEARKAYIFWLGRDLYSHA